MLVDFFEMEMEAELPVGSDLSSQDVISKSYSQEQQPPAGLFAGLPRADHGNSSPRCSKEAVLQSNTRKRLP